MRCFLALCCILFAPRAGRSQAAPTVGDLPREIIILTEGVRADGKHLMQVMRAACRRDKDGVLIYYFDALTGVLDDAEPTVVPIARDNGKCDPRKILEKFNELPVYEGFIPLPPAELFARDGGRETATPRWLYQSDLSGRASIEVFDPETRRTVASIETEPRLIGGMARSPVGNRLYATLWRSTTTTPAQPAQIAIINTDTNRIEDRITLTADMLPTDPAVSPDGALLYFADETAGLIVVDLAARIILDRIPAARAGAATNQFSTLSLSPDGLILCLTDSAGVALLDTRTRTFIARINMTLVKRSIPPVFHPNGSLFYLIDRRTNVISLVSYNTSDLTEAGRVPLPSTFDPYNAVITPHGATLMLDGFLRPAGQTANSVLLTVDLVRNQLLPANETLEPTVGALGIVVR